MKKLLSLVLTLALVLCAANAFALEKVTIAATPVPHVVILEFIAPFMEELGYEAPVVVTGGLGRQIAAQCATPLTYVDELLLEGLRLIYEKNR